MNRLAYFARWSLPLLNDYKLGRAMKATVLRLVNAEQRALCSKGAREGQLHCLSPMTIAFHRGSIAVQSWIDFLMRFP